MVRYLIYLLRWGILALPCAWALEALNKVIVLGNIYWEMVISQIAVGAVVYFIDRLIWRPDK